MVVKNSFLRKGSSFEQAVKDIETIAEKILSYPEIEGVFGKDWLNSEIKKGFFPFLLYRITPIEEAIKKLKQLPGFDIWKANILLNQEGFDSYEFEILEICRLANLSDHIELFPPVHKEEKKDPSFSEVRIIRNEVEFYVEMTKFYSISNPKNKIKKLIEKGRNQIPKESCGFIFVDVGDVTLKEIKAYDNNEIKYSLVSKLEDLVEVVDQFFKGNNTRILGILFIEPYLIQNERNLIESEKKICFTPNEFNKLKFDTDKLMSLIFNI